MAQPADLPIPAATTAEFPAGIRIASVDGARVYTDAKGRVLYGLDLRTLLRWGADPAQYCKTRCEDWEPLLASTENAVNIAFPRGFGDRARAQSGNPPAEGFHADPAKAPDWTVIAGPHGPQWVYKGWHLVHIRKGAGARSKAFDGSAGLSWNTLKYVPPVPVVVAPDRIAPVFVAGAYALADGEGRLLFTGKCGKNCAAWQPLAGALASRGVGDWEVDRSGDRPQWTWRGMPVYVASGGDLAQLPARAKLLRPGG